MANVPNQFLRHTMNWLLSGGERASCTVAWDSSETPADPAAAADALETRAGVLWTAIAEYYSTQTSYHGSFTRVVDVDGTILATYDRTSGPAAGTTDQAPLPNEVAVAVSLQTELAGGSHRGRIYLPAPHRNQMAAGAVLQAGLPPAFGEAMADYLATLPAEGNDYLPVVASFTAGALTIITHGRVGNVPDSQRGRRKSQGEVYAPFIV